MVSNAYVSLLGKEHPDISYLKDERISLVLSKALAETFRAKPNDPKQYFAKYLLNHSAQQKAAQKRKERDQEVVLSRQSQSDKLALASKKKAEEDAKIYAIEQQKAAFFKKLDQSEDLHDNLEELTNFLAQNTDATGVYIGKLVFPLKNIEEDAGDNDHQDEEAPKVIRYLYASQDHKFVIDRTLPPDQGITHDVFKESSQVAPEDEDPEAVAEGAQASGKDKDIIFSFKHVYVPEVVREPRMNFQKVPRLGAYMAIPLCYNSCLFDESLEASVAEQLDVLSRQENQQKEMQEYYEGYNTRKEQAQSSGDPFDEEEKQWEEITCGPFKTTEEKWVVGLDTMGQDRPFTDQQKRFALETVQKFKQIWEHQESKSLTKDRDNKLTLMRADKQTELEQLQHVNDEIDKRIEEVCLEREDLISDEDLRDIVSKQTRLTLQAQTFLSAQEWIEQLQSIQKMRVVKMPKIIQSLLYLLGLSREDICEPKTNQIFWKKANHYVPIDMPQKMALFKLEGEKKGPFKAYQTLNFCEKVLTLYTEEDVANYHSGFLKLFKWLKTAIDGRKANITRRKALTKRAKEDRIKKIEMSEERKKNRENFLIESLEKFSDEHRDEIIAYEEYQEDQRKKNSEEYGEEQGSNNEDDEAKEPPVLPVFNQKEAEEKFDEENPQVEIPREVIDEIHNDWILTEEEETKLVEDYWAGKSD